MPTLPIPFGRSFLATQIDERRLAAILAPTRSRPQPGDRLVREALQRPIGSPRLQEIARPGQEVAIVTSDLTRPCPSARLLPPVLKELEAAGIGPAAVTVVVALGLHRPMSTSELTTAVGEEFISRTQVINHDVDQTVRVGVTSAGTPVDILRSVVQADLRICLGNIDLHWFAGFSGGSKALFPGCAGEEGVAANHSMMTSQGASAGRLEGNPVRSDLEEAASLVGIDFILNVIVDGEHHIIGAVAGGAVAAHRQGAQLAARRSVVPLPEAADVVLVSAGGYPKDINLYQAQKALDNARHALRPGGIIILVAECREGFGNETFEQWMREATSPDACLHRIQQEFVLGGHKAAGVARVMQEAQVYLVSALSPSAVAQCGLTPFSTVDDALATAFGTLGPAARVVAMPQGGSTLPSVK